MNTERPELTLNKFIAGDWGTSNLRLYLCDTSSERAEIIETRFGVGVSQVNEDFEERFFNLVQDWIDENPGIKVVLSGMVGSTIGWKEAPYLACPINERQIASGRLSFTARGTEFSILAGLRTTNPLSAPDVMRGEELQLLGWMRTNDASSGTHLFALPGTHNKWALCQEGQITNFLTAFTGELFALLRNHSILITKQNSFSFNENAFREGLGAIKNLGNAHLIHALFATRAKQVLGEIAGEDGMSYLSGLIIGADVQGALNTFSDFQRIIVIGDPTLAQHYQLTLNYFGHDSQSCDPSEIASAGYETVYNEIINTFIASEER